MGKGFKELLVWQKSRDLAIRIYEITKRKNFQKDYGLSDQIRRSAVSIPSNIAEGDERDTDKEAVRFLYIAKGSLAELRTQLEIASQIGYVDDESFKTLEQQAVTIGKMLGSLIKARSLKL